MLGPFATASRRTPIHQVSLLSHAATVARRLHIDVHDNDNDNAWQRGPLWPHRMGPISVSYNNVNYNDNDSLIVILQ